MPKLRFNFNLINAVHSVPNCCSSRWIEWKMMIIIAYLFISKKLRVANFAHFQLCVCVRVWRTFHLVSFGFAHLRRHSTKFPSRNFLPATCQDRESMCTCVHGFVCVSVCGGRGNCNSSKKLQLPKDVWKCVCGGRNRKRVPLPLPTAVSKNKKTWN